MGKHTDPETLQFIEKIKKKAELAGFRTEEEYKILDGLFWIDLVFSPYEKGHDTFITLEIESRNNERIQKNLQKILKSTAKDVEKPYYHFIVIYKGKLSESNRYLINRMDSHNIKVFEDLKKDPQQIEDIFTEIEGLQVNIKSYIERKGKVNPAETVKETILGLGSINPVVIIENKPFPINQVTLTSVSQTSMDEPLISSGEIFDIKKFRRLAVIPIPRDVYTLVVPNTTIAEDTYLDRKPSFTTSLVLEPCNFPAIINLENDKTGKSGRIHTNIDSTEADVVQLKKYEDLLRSIFVDKRKLEIYDSKAKKVFVANNIVDEEFKRTDEWYSKVSELAFIQQTTSIRIPAPKNLSITGDESDQIKMIKTIIQTGEYEDTFTEVTISTKKMVIQKLIKHIQTRGSLKDFTIINNNDTQNILGINIPLGEASWKFKDITLKDPIEKITELLANVNPEEKVNLVLIPHSSNVLKVIYSGWKK